MKSALDFTKLASIGGIVIDRELEMFSPNMKTSHTGECLAQNDGRTRWISGQQR